MTFFEKVLTLKTEIVEKLNENIRVKKKRSMFYVIEKIFNADRTSKRVVVSREFFQLRFIQLLDRNFL